MTETSPQPDRPVPGADPASLPTPEPGTPAPPAPPLKPEDGGELPAERLQPAPKKEEVVPEPKALSLEEKLAAPPDADEQASSEADFSLRQLDAVAEAPASPEARGSAGPPVLSVVIPCYNERAHIREILEAVRKVDLPKEVVVVDDCSKDGTRELLQRELKGLYDRLVLHEKNQGKGAALRTGFRSVTGGIVVVQDADLEYDPRDWKKMYDLIAGGTADVVFGSRFAAREVRAVGRWWHAYVNGVLTRWSNVFSGLNLTDMETCYKMFRADVLRKIVLKEDRFGFEPEIAAKVARLGVRIYEVPISYAPRSRKEGKKIGVKDGIRAIWCILKYNLWSR